jgi:hypothetical protein
MFFVWIMAYWMFLFAPPSVPVLKEPRDDLA